MGNAVFINTPKILKDNNVEERTHGRVDIEYILIYY